MFSGVYLNQPVCLSICVPMQFFVMNSSYSFAAIIVLKVGCYIDRIECLQDEVFNLIVPNS